ncbi:MAG TPA: uroporphyrinogen-III synthase, partial [Sphingomonas sp.]|nr:uroporphyrinogen-III synthase [Sphingomonas sp.]
DDHDALMLTSANAVRHAGPDLHLYRALPVYAVGEATAAAATQAGFGPVISGPGDAAALVARMREDGVKRPLHLAGREHRAIDDAPFIIARCVVYAAEPVDTLPAAAAAALARDAVALIHSPRAAIVFAELLAAAGIQPESVAIAAISRAASAGRWREAAIAPTPDDSALLAAAARLCEKA